MAIWKIGLWCSGIHNKLILVQQGGKLGISKCWSYKCELIQRSRRTEKSCSYRYVSLPWLRFLCARKVHLLCVWWLSYAFLSLPSCSSCLCPTCPVTTHKPILAFWVHFTVPGIEELKRNSKEKKEMKNSQIVLCRVLLGTFLYLVVKSPSNTDSRAGVGRSLSWGIMGGRCAEQLAQTHVDGRESGAMCSHGGNFFILNHCFHWLSNKARRLG